MDQGLAGVIGALIGATSGSVIAYMQFEANREQQAQAAKERQAQRKELIDEREKHAEEQQQIRRDTYLFESFKWFAGGSQERNIGISIVEGFWEQVPHLRSILIPLLANQATYLLTQSKQDKAMHEQDNLLRIMSLLVGYEEKSKYFPYYQQILNAIDIRQKGGASAGIAVDANTLKKWRDWIEKIPKPEQQSERSE